MSNRATPIDRPGARVILLDDADRVLLFSSPMPDGASAGRLWVPPGGAVEAGEDWGAAARRELREETGLDVLLGPCLWVREHVWYWAARGAWYRSIERFFLARTHAGAIDVTGWTSEEKRVVTDWRWWTVEELCATADVLVPRRLGELLAPILRGVLPPSPVTLVEEADDDVPSPIDFHDPAHARTWTDETPRKRPWRASFFAELCKALGGRQLRVLELGSGPGHLAREILTRCDVAAYLALDFSAAMHDLAREHLGELASRVTFVTRDFRTPAWTAGLSELDTIVTMQAVHETRHKRRALPLLAQARALLAPGGQLLYCDHYAEGGKMPGLLLDRAEQPEVLRAAGYANVRLLRDEGGMALYAAT